MQEVKTIEVQKGRARVRARLGLGFGVNFCLQIIHSHRFFLPRMTSESVYTPHMSYIHNNVYWPQCQPLVDAWHCEMEEASMGATERVL